VRDAWDGHHLRFTFRRTVDSRTMALWQEILQIASDIQFRDEEDTIIWQFASSGKFSVQTMYAVINDRGVKQVYTPVMWKISVPPRLHIFLWLLANNKLLTRDNLLKRKNLDDVSCLFCSEPESVCHLFFECCVSKIMWQNFSEMCGKKIGTDFESVASLWLCAKKFKSINIGTIAVMWGIWKMRNCMRFQENQWLGMQGFFFKCAKLIRRWRVIQSEEVSSQLECLAKKWERRGAMPPMLPWVQQVPSMVVLPVPDDQPRVHEFSVSLDGGAVTDSISFVSPELENLLEPDAQVVPDPVGSVEHVVTVSYE
jgi:hypothetical protein